jgi:hypothetical protein
VLLYCAPSHGIDWAARLLPSFPSLSFPSPAHSTPPPPWLLTYALDFGFNGFTSAAPDFTSHEDLASLPRVASPPRLRYKSAQLQSIPDARDFRRACFQDKFRGPLPLYIVHSIVKSAGERLSTTAGLFFPG